MAEQVPEPATPVELTTLQCALILTGLTVMLTTPPEPPPRVAASMDDLVLKLIGACEALHGSSSELDSLRTDMQSWLRR